MFKKVLFFCMITHIFAFEALHTQILEVQEQNIFVKDDEKIRLNANAIIIKNLKHSRFIVASARVVEKENKLAKLQIKPFTTLEQKALPTLNLKVEKGDELIINFLYNRALLIAPNETSYKQIEQNYPQLYFMHPDILAAHMIKEFKLSPKIKDFQIICSNNALGLVLFALKDEIAFVDCTNFSLLFTEKFSTQDENSTQTPFYSRIKGYKKNFFNFSEKAVKDYYAYYNTLIKR